jgi:hypothetical protein
MKEKKQKTKNISQILLWVTVIISLVLSVLSLWSFIYLQDLHQKTTVSSSNFEMMLLDKINCLEGEKEACRPNNQEKH